MIINPRRTLASMLLMVLFAVPSTVNGQEAPEPWAGRSPSLDQLKLGYAAMGEESYQAARENYLAALEYASTRELRFQALVGLGSAEAALDLLDEARASFDRALEIKPDHPETLFAQGIVAKDQGRLDDAAELFAQAAVRRPGFGAALTQLGVVYAYQDRHEEAEAACWKAISVTPKDVEALLCLGVARYHLGFYAEAAQAFDAVLEIEPHSPRARYSLGLCKLYQEDREGALEDHALLEDLDSELAGDLYDRIFPTQ